MKHARSDYDRIQDPAGIIPQDEPVFLLRATDQTAPATVRHWAFLQYRSQNRLMGDAAMSQAEAMEAWQEKHGKKLADAPPDALASPSDADSR